MTPAQKHAKALDLILGRMLYSDPRRIVDHASLPYYVAKDGRIVQQFATTAERTKWLEGQVMLRNLPRVPNPKPMGQP